MEELCSLEGCNRSIKDGIQIKQGGVVIGQICEECLGSAKGAKIFLKKDADEKYFTLFELQRIENPL